MSYIRELWTQRATSTPQFFVHLSDEAIERWKASPIAALFNRDPDRCGGCGHGLHRGACSTIFNAKVCGCGR